jgi:DNA invertase Pin-like site-specific DNA recombinase
MQNKLRVAVYIRVAREDDMAITNQEEILRRFAEKQGYTNLSVYTDNGVVGFGLNRPAFNRMNEDITNGLVDTVIVKDVSRISRNYLELPVWVNNIRGKGVSFISVQDGLNGDSLNILGNIIPQAFKDYCLKQRKKPPYRRAGKAKR